MWRNFYVTTLEKRDSLGFLLIHESSGNQPYQRTLRPDRPIRITATGSRSGTTHRAKDGCLSACTLRACPEHDRPPTGRLSSAGQDCLAGTTALRHGSLTHIPRRRIPFRGCQSLCSLPACTSTAGFSPTSSAGPTSPTASGCRPAREWISPECHGHSRRGSWRSPPFPGH